MESNPVTIEITNINCDQTGITHLVVEIQNKSDSILLIRDIGDIGFYEQFSLIITPSNGDPSFEGEVTSIPYETVMDIEKGIAVGEKVKIKINIKEYEFKSVVQEGDSIDVQLRDKKGNEYRSSRVSIKC